MKRALPPSVVASLPAPLPARSGTTLTEVLVSVLIMSIGIVSLSSMFPLSMVRQIQATQLTNATILRYNAEAMLTADQSLLQAVPVNSKVIIDPLGYNIYNNERAALKDIFGNDGTNPSGTLARLSGGRTSVQGADFLVTLPDSWSLVHEGVGTNLTPTQVEVQHNFGSAPPLPTSLVRVTLFGEGLGRRISISRFVAPVGSSVDGTKYTLKWTEDINGNSTLDPGEDLDGNGVLDTYPVPAGFTVGMVRIDQQNRNYTWLVTARRGSTTNISLDVVVFFRRAFDVKDETLIDATFQAGVRDVVIRYTAATKPFLKRGSFVLDVNNAQWYRIKEIAAETSTSATLQLDRPAASASPSGAGKAIFMKGIVDVFPIADKDIGL